MTSDIQKAWRESEWLNNFDEIENHPDIELADDLSTVTVYDMPSADDGYLLELERLINLLIEKKVLISNFDKLPKDSIIIQYIHKDRQTGEIIVTYDMQRTTYLSFVDQ